MSILRVGSTPAPFTPPNDAQATAANLGPGSVYYKLSSTTVSSTSNDGTLTSGQSVTISPSTPAAFVTVNPDTIPGNQARLSLTLVQPVESAGPYATVDTTGNVPAKQLGNAASGVSGLTSSNMAPANVNGTSATPSLRTTDRTSGAAVAFPVADADVASNAAIDGAKLSLSSGHGLGATSTSAMAGNDPRVVNESINATDPAYGGLNAGMTQAQQAAALQTFLNALATSLTGHGTGRLPAGTWNIGATTLNADKLGFKLLADGGRSQGTTIVYTGAGTALTCRSSRGTVEGIKIDTTANASAVAIDAAGQFSGGGDTTLLTLRDVYLSGNVGAGALGMGILLDAATITTIADSQINGFSSSISGQMSTLTSGSTTLPADLVTTFTLNVASTVGFRSSGQIGVGFSAFGNASTRVVNYTGVTATSFTGCTLTSAADEGVVIGASTVVTWANPYTNAVTIEDTLFGQALVAAIRNPGASWRVRDCVFEPLWGVSSGFSTATGALLVDTGMVVGGGLTYEGNWHGDNNWYRLFSGGTATGTGPFTLRDTYTNAATVTGLSAGQTLYWGNGVNFASSAFNQEVVTIQSIDATAKTITLTGPGLANTHSSGEAIVPAGSQAVTLRGAVTGTRGAGGVSMRGNRYSGPSEKHVVVVGPLDGLTVQGGTMSNMAYAGVDLGISNSPTNVSVRGVGNANGYLVKGRAAAAWELQSHTGVIVKSDPLTSSDVSTMPQIGRYLPQNTSGMASGSVFGAVAYAQNGGPWTGIRFLPGAISGLTDLRLVVWDGDGTATGTAGTLIATTANSPGLTASTVPTPLALRNPGDTANLTVTTWPGQKLILGVGGIGTTMEAGADTLRVTTMPSQTPVLSAGFSGWLTTTIPGNLPNLNSFSSILPWIELVR